MFLGQGSKYNGKFRVADSKNLPKNMIFSAAAIYCREVLTRKTMKNQWFCLVFDEKIMVWGGFSSL